MKIPKYFYFLHTPGVIYKKLWKFKIDNEQRYLLYSTIKWNASSNESIDKTICKKCKYRKVCAERTSRLFCVVASKEIEKEIIKSNAINFYLKK